MNWLKQNWIKVGIGVLVLFALIYFFGTKDTKQNTASINNAIQTPTPTQTSSASDPRIAAIEQTLPHFEDYPAKVYPIPPKPLVNHNSNPYGMRFWTVLENIASTSDIWDENGRRFPTRTGYDMGGHYLMDRYGTGNPDVLIVDGLTGQVFNEYGGINYQMKPDSSLVIFEPFREDCFTSSGDYECPYDGIGGGGNPRYAEWNGKQFITLCEPEVKNWKVVSCGMAADKNSDLYGQRKVSWMGTVVATMTYGRLRIKTLGSVNGNVFSTSGTSFRASDNLDTAQYGYSEFVAEPYDVEDNPARTSKMTDNINDGDLVQVTGYWEKPNINTDIPWVLIERIEKYSK